LSIDIMQRKRFISPVLQVDVWDGWSVSQDSLWCATMKIPISQVHDPSTFMPGPDVTLLISHLARELTGRDVIRGIVTYGDPDYGPVVRLVVDLDAREALELWLKLVRHIPYKRYGIVIGVRWLGENNVSKDELVDYVVKIMVEGGLRTIALGPLDVVKELRGERGKR
jgi:hypothetical protein